MPAAPTRSDVEIASRGAPALVQAMSRPEFYPNRPASVEVRQTHISWVFLAGEYVYKVKKTLRLPFVDLSTLEQRRHLCLEELRLNRRLAGDFYLGVVPILATPSGFMLGDGGTDGETSACEYAVKMKRLPQAQMLDRLLGRDTVKSEHIDALAGRLAAFHREASQARGWEYGSAAAVWALVLANLDECARFEGYSCDAKELDTIARHSREFIASSWGLLNRRARTGRVREGHGDLRCEHICFDDGGIAIFDCLEFSERLRYCDVACDIAFLAMDLERLGAPALASELVARYAAEARDDDFFGLLPFYKCYRAAVRAKVESIRSLEPEFPAAERSRARALARSYFMFACRYWTQVRKPALLVVCGLPGTGKSTLARALGDRLNFEVLGTDPTRKRLAGAAPSARLSSSYETGVYEKEFSRRTYETLLATAENRLVRGEGVVLDATFREPAERARALGLGRRLAVPVLFVECRADEAEVMRRLVERARLAGEASDADPAVYLRQRADFTPLDEIPEEARVGVDTTREPEKLAAEVERELDRRRSGSPAAPIKKDPAPPCARRRLPGRASHEEAPGAKRNRRLRRHPGESAP